MPPGKRPCRTQRVRERAQLVAETMDNLLNERHLAGVEIEVEEEPRVYRETWRTSSAENHIVCKLFKAADDSHTCGIMHEATNAVEVPDLPSTWPLEPSKHKCADEEAANTAELECGHVFHPVALAFHFLVSDMRCPVCRTGHTELMDLASVPLSIRPAFAAKIETSRQAQLQDHLASLPPLPTVEVLSDIELEMRLLTGSGSTVRTRVVFNDQHVDDIQRVAMQASQASDQHSLLTTGLGVHRSFQRLIRCIVARQHTMNSDACIQFALTHPLVPVAIASTPMPVSVYWSRLFNPVEMLEQRGSVELFCPGVGGTQAVACLHSQYNDHTHTPHITIDVNMHMLITISTYVNEVLNSIRESIQQTSVFDSTHSIEISLTSINGIQWDV
jgi:hypothetical protein